MESIRVMLKGKNYININDDEMIEVSYYGQIATDSIQNFKLVYFDIKFWHLCLLLVNYEACIFIQVDEDCNPKSIDQAKMFMERMKEEGLFENLNRGFWEKHPRPEDVELRDRLYGKNTPQNRVSSQSVASNESNEYAKPLLIECPCCGQKVSNQAIACPTCGQPIKETSVVRKEIRTNNPYIIPCVACGRDVSIRSSACPNCGNPVGRKCPKCGNYTLEISTKEEHQAEVSKERYVANLNPLKPFTLVDKKKKIISREYSFLCTTEKCSNCGYLKNKRERI